MKNVQVTMSTVGQLFPSSVVATDYLFELQGPDFRSDSVFYTGAVGLTHVFQNVQPGVYTVTVTLRDSLGVAIGSPVTSASFTVEADITLQVPAGLTVQVITV
jgi:hypothetical protein